MASTRAMTAALDRELPHSPGAKNPPIPARSAPIGQRVGSLGISGPTLQIYGYTSHPAGQCTYPSGNRFRNEWQLSGHPFLYP